MSTQPPDGQRPQGSLQREPAPPSRKGGVTRTPIFLSGLVYPGVGQFAQKRLAHALFFSILFTVVLIAFFVYATISIFTFYSLAFSDRPVDAAPDPKPMLLLLGVAVLLYVLSLLDTYRAFRRGSTQAARRRVGIVEEVAGTDEGAR